jgi:chloride channel protein, CIC family
MRLPGFGLRSDEFEYVRLILLAVIVGIFGALGNLGFRELIAFFSWLFRGLEWNALGIDRGGWYRALTPIVLLSGGGGMLILNYLSPGDVFGYGFPNFLEMVNLGMARIKRSWIVIKAAGAALSLGSGASVGREGPIAQIGGAIGSAIAQFFSLSPTRAKVLVAAGAGAGIATTFNAPIGGLMFAQEIVLLGHAELANLTLLIVATTTAVVTSHAIMGGGGAVFDVPGFVLRSYVELITYGLMGGALGALGAAYISFFHATGRWFRRLNAPEWIRLGIGLGVVGVIAIFLPQNLSDGYPVVNSVMAGEYGLAMLLALTFAKFFASSISLECGAPGGVFGPTFFIGTMAGGAFQRMSLILIPELTGPRGSYALIGLGAFLAAVTHAPLTALFLLFEMTHSYEVAVPAMVATIAALVVARAIQTESLDTYTLAREGKTLEISQERLALTQIPVSAVMTKHVTYVRENASLADVLQVAGDTAQSTLPVVGADGELIGLIVTRELLALLVSGEDLGPLVNAYDLCKTDCPFVKPESNLDVASQIIEHEGIDEVPVAERGGGALLGLVTRMHIAQALNRVTVSLTSLATRDQGIFWATGYRVDRIEIPEASAGTTIRKLDPRARFGVTVLACQDGEDPDAGFIPISPDRLLKHGDLVIVAGRPTDIRRFARELESHQPAETATEAQAPAEGKR